MDALTSLRFASETEPAERLRQVIDDLGRYVNPNFLAAAQKADQENMKLMMSNQDDYWERRSKIDPFFVERSAKRRISLGELTDEDDPSK